MDRLLAERLNHLNTQSDLLRDAEGRYRLHEAKRKTLEGELFLMTVGANATERGHKVYANAEYSSFMAELAKLETEFNHQKRRFSILESAYLAEHATFNREAKLIHRQGVVT